MNSINLDFLVIGVQKSASSWLYYCLKEHPELILPAYKKEREYIGGPLYNEKGGIKWYYTLFDIENRKNKKVGDVSVEYFFDNTSPIEIQKNLPHCNFILLLRNPVDRFKSAYFWYLRKGLIDRDVDINAQIIKAIDQNRSNEIEPIVLDLLSRGYYEEQLDCFLAEFSPGQFYVAFYEEIEADSQKVLADIYSFLNVKSDFVPTSINSRPKKNSYNSFLIHAERLGSKNRVISKFANFSNQVFANFFNKNLKQNIFDPKVMSLLNDHYKQKNIGLSKKLKSLSNGKRHLNSVNIFWKW